MSFQSYRQAYRAQAPIDHGAANRPVPSPQLATSHAKNRLRRGLIRRAVVNSPLARFAGVLAASLAIGCESGSAPHIQPQETAMNALTISDLTDGVETLIGTITFDEAKNGTLSLEAEGPEAERLREAWEQTSKQDSLVLDRTERKEINGEKVSVSKSTTVPKGGERYSDAVWSHLESEYGFLVDKKR